MAIGALGVVGLLSVLDDTDAPRPRPATLADYWAGTARWDLAAKWTGTELGQPDSQPGAGAHIEVVGGRWYLFDRGHMASSCPDGQVRMLVQVRESTDRGATWSRPVTAIEPTPGTPWSCAATDGDAVYDAERKTWRYLFQCKPDGGGWDGCYAERKGTSPMGPFTADARNPVIRGGDLWRAICDPGDDCAQAPVNEGGTYNVFHRDRDGYWISFHGSDGTHGYRGIARTTDFRHFAVDRPEAGLPADAILDKQDGAGFRETWAGGQSIGAGAGTIVREGAYWYALNEFADISLRCIPGQNWVVGLFRSSSPASTTWEQFPGGNPIAASSRAPEENGKPRGCNVLYPSIFRDPASGEWYLMYGRTSSDPAHSAIYLYRLVSDTSALVNGDFARGDAAGWVPGAGVRLAVPRLPNQSPDSTAYLSFGCGVPGCRGLHQDVRVADEGARFSFGGSFRAETAGGALRLVVQQLDERGRVVRDDTVRVQAGPAYRRVRGHGEVAEGAQVLRYVLQPGGTGTFGADNLFLTLGR